MTSKTIDIVFDGPPSAEAPRFVGVEDVMGNSVHAGEWVQRQDGYWVLRIKDVATRPCTLCPEKPQFFGVNLLMQHVKENHPGYSVGPSVVIGGF